MDAKLSMWSSYYIELGPEEAVLEMKKNGYSYSELSDEHGKMLLDRGDPKEVGAAFKAFLEKENFHMPQGHLWLKCKLCSTENALEILYPWLDLYEAIGIKNCVLHCDAIAGEPELSMEERYARNMAQLKKIEAYIQDMNLCICLENLRALAENEQGLTQLYGIDALLNLVNALDEEHFGICLDTGHLNLTDKDQRSFILKAGKRLRALHIADNEGETDQHMMPFGKGQVDFVEVVKALREIDYHGLFNLEIPGERKAPLEVKGYKMEYIRKCYEYLMEKA
ncbi:MAG: sugar phosphate isomerase/epimerase [Clostridiales bacterium]|nr:sugar phosphate isomerase/epimerase [Clostridiales bacterium]